MIRSRMSLIAICATLALAVGAPSLAFNPSKHREITRDGVEPISRTIGTKTFTFTERAISEIQDANNDVDGLLNGNFFRYYMHLNNSFIEAGTERLVDHKSQIISLLQQNPPDGKEARRLLGGALHTLQDYYPHSNWISGLNNTFEDGRLGNQVLTGSILAVDPCPVQEHLLQGAGQTSLALSWWTGEDGCSPSMWPGECRHGTTVPIFGEVCKGINADDAGRPGFPPYGDLFPTTRGVAESATRRYVEEILSAPGVDGNSRAIRALMGRKLTFAVAFDTSGSMVEEIGSAKTEVAGFLQPLLGTDDEPDEYVLVTFGDTVRSAFRTTNSTLFLIALSSLSASGNGGCAESSFGGTYYAAVLSSPKSTIYTVTDADVKDRGLAGNVAWIQKEKELEIIPVLTGTCSPPDPLYFELAAASGTQVVFVDPLEVGDTLVTLASARVEAPLTPVFQARENLQFVGARSYSFFVDATIGRLLVTAGLESKTSVTLKDPSGAPVQLGQVGVNVLDAAEATIYRVDPPRLSVGTWSIDLVGSGEVGVSVQANSELELLSVDAVSLTDTFHPMYQPISGQPPANSTQTLLARMLGPFGSPTFDLVRFDGTVVAAVGLSPSAPFASYDEFTGAVPMPNEPFYLRATGTESSQGTPYQRVFPTLISPQKVKIVLDSLTDAGCIEPGQTHTYRFDVTNFTAQTRTFRITAIDDQGFVCTGGPCPSPRPAQLVLAGGTTSSVEVDVTVPAGTPGGTRFDMLVSAMDIANTAFKDVARVQGVVGASVVVGAVNVVSPTSVPVAHVDTSNPAIVDIVGTGFALGDVVTIDNVLVPSSDLQLIGSTTWRFSYRAESRKQHFRVSNPVNVSVEGRDTPGCAAQLSGTFVYAEPPSFGPQPILSCAPNCTKDIDATLLVTITGRDFASAGDALGENARVFLKDVTPSRPNPFPDYPILPEQDIPAQTTVSEQQSIDIRVPPTVPFGVWQVVVENPNPVFDFGTGPVFGTTDRPSQLRPRITVVDSDAPFLADRFPRPEVIGSPSGGSPVTAIRVHVRDSGSGVVGASIRLNGTVPGPGRIFPDPASVPVSEDYSLLIPPPSLAYGFGSSIGVSVDAEDAAGNAFAGNYVVRVTSAADGDGDGLPDEWETANALDPSDDGDAATCLAGGRSDSFRNGPCGDPDEDGTDNAQEYAQGSDPSAPDVLLTGPSSPAGATGLGTPPLARAFFGDGALWRGMQSNLDLAGDPIDGVRINMGSHGAVVASGDLDAGPDGVTELVTGAGYGFNNGPQIRGFNRDGTPIARVNFFAYGTLRHGVNVATGELDGNDGGTAEIISGAGPGASFGPHARGWNVDLSPMGQGVQALGSQTGTAPLSIIAYPGASFGVNVAAGAIDRENPNNPSSFWEPLAEVITGPGPGPQNGPQVRAWNYDPTPGVGVNPIGRVNFNAYGSGQWGVRVAAGDIDSGRPGASESYDALYAEIVTAPGPGPGFGSHIRGFNFDGDRLKAFDVGCSDPSRCTPPKLSFYAFSGSCPGGSSCYGGKVGVADIDGDGIGELAVGAGPGPDRIESDTRARLFNFDGLQLQGVPGSPELASYDYTRFAFGANVDGASFDSNTMTAVTIRSSGLSLLKGTQSLLASVSSAAFTSAPEQTAILTKVQDLVADLQSPMAGNTNAAAISRITDIEGDVQAEAVDPFVRGELLDMLAAAKDYYLTTETPTADIEARIPLVEYIPGTGTPSQIDVSPLSPHDGYVVNDGVVERIDFGCLTVSDILQPQGYAIDVAISRPEGRVFTLTGEDCYPPGALCFVAEVVNLLEEVPTTGHILISRAVVQGPRGKILVLTPPGSSFPTERAYVIAEGAGLGPPGQQGFWSSPVVTVEPAEAGFLATCSSNPSRTASADGTLFVIDGIHDPSTAVVSTVGGTVPTYNDFAFSPIEGDSRLFAIHNCGIDVIDTSDDTVSSAGFGTGGKSIAAALLVDGSARLYTVDHLTDTLEVHDLDAGLTIAQVAVGRYPGRVRTTRAAERVLVTTLDPPELVVLDATGQELGTVRLTHQNTATLDDIVFDLALSPEETKAHIVNPLEQSVDVVPFRTSDVPGDALLLEDAIASTPDSAFSPANLARNRRRTLLRKLEQAVARVEQARQKTGPARDNLLNAAINMLENDIRQRMDGFFGGNPSNDWIHDQDAQAILLNLIDAMLREVRGELSADPDVPATFPDDDPEALPDPGPDPVPPGA